MNLEAFFRDWWSLVSWTKDTPEKFKKAQETLVAVLLICGFSASVVGSLKEVAQFYAIPALILLAVYVTWQGGRAWERSRGPVIECGDLMPDEKVSMFDMRVRNNGSGEVMAHVYAAELTEEPWRIKSEIEIHWRSIDAAEQIRLSGQKAEWAGVLYVVQSDDGHPQIGLAARPAEGTRFPFVPLCEPVPLDQQKEMHLTLRIAFEKDGVEVKDRLRKFAIVPSPSSPLRYEVRSIA